MKERVKAGLILLVASVLGFGLGMLNRSCVKRVDRIYTPYQETVMELLDSLEETQNQIDTIYIQLKENNDNYKKVIDSVVSLNRDESVCFFLEYIADQRERLDSISKSK